jgi:hypothetical protein
MSYVIKKFNEGEVKFRNGAAGWLMKDGEFRPLMADAIQELYTAGLIDSSCISATETARQEYVANAFLDYASRATMPTLEERFEARNAFGPGTEVVNVITGHKWRT